MHYLSQTYTETEIERLPQLKILDSRSSRSTPKMDDTNPEILEARAKLQAKFQSRIGGKGTQRRKVKAKTTGVVVK